MLIDAARDSAATYVAGVSRSLRRTHLTPFAFKLPNWRIQRILWRRSGVRILGGGERARGLRGDLGIRIPAVVTVPLRGHSLSNQSTATDDISTTHGE